MKRILCAVLALACVAWSLAACGASSHDTESSAGSGSTAVDSVSVSPIAIPKDGVGDTLELKTKATRLAVTPQETKTLPAVSAYGSQVHPALYAVRLTVEDVGKGSYRDSVINCVAVVDGQAQSYSPEVMVTDADGNDLPGSLDAVSLSPGDKASGWVYFALKEPPTPRVLTYTPDGGWGDDAGAWSLQ
jgi:hypothetical protein